MPTSNFTGEKFLIVMLQDGGTDTIHRYIARDATRRGQIQSLRPTLSFSDTEIDTTYAANHINANWMLHPSLALLKPIWDAGEMAICHRVGPMVSNLNEYSTAQIRDSISSFYNGPIVNPVGLGAHDWQQYASASMVARDFTDSNSVSWTMRGSGFLGRLAQLFAPYNPALGSPAGPPPIIPTGIQCMGAIGTMANLIQVSASAEKALRFKPIGFKFNRNFANSSKQTSALARLDAVMAIPRSETRQEVFRQINEQARNATAFFTPCVETANGGAPYATVDAAFAGETTGWQAMFRTIARALSQRTTGYGLARRTIFVLNRNGYDTHGANHGKITGGHPSLMLEEAQAISKFRAAILALPDGTDLWKNITIVDWSEFGRTTIENGATGTDHGWGRICTLYGGSIRGNGSDGSTGEFGVAPTDYGTGNGSHDVHPSGWLYPYFSQEQIMDPILRWMGADDDDIEYVLPRRPVFDASPNLFWSGTAARALDSLTYSELHAVHGFREVRSEYVGQPLVRIRSSVSPNNEVDVLADPGSARFEITLSSPVSPTTWGATLADFIAHASGLNATGDGTIRTFYDLTGKGRHAQQTTAANQMLLISAGVLNDLDGFPAVANANSRTASWTGTNMFSTANMVAAVLGSVSGNTGTLYGTREASESAGANPSGVRLLLDTFNTSLRAHVDNLMSSGGSTVATRQLRAAVTRSSDNRLFGSVGSGSDTTPVTFSKGSHTVTTIYLNRSQASTANGHNAGRGELWLLAEPADPDAFLVAARAALL